MSDVNIYEWEDIAESQEFEHGDEFVTLQNYQELEQENTELRAKLERVKTVIEIVQYSNENLEINPKYLSAATQLLLKELGGES